MEKKKDYTALKTGAMFLGAGVAGLAATPMVGPVFGTGVAISTGVVLTKALSPSKKRR